jgi:hypothetical protein
MFQRQISIYLDMNWLSGTSRLWCMVTKMHNRMLIAPSAIDQTLSYWKKAWSYFMLNKILAWTEVALAGNPTRSSSVLELINSMKKMEAARLGVPSQAR